MFTGQMLDNMKIIKKELLSVKGANTEAYKLACHVEKELEEYEQLFGKISWSIADIEMLFTDQEEPVPPKETLLEMGRDLDDVVATAMCERGWDIITDFVQNYISGCKNQCLSKKSRFAIC